MSNEKPEIFRGHIEECFKHLGDRLTTFLPKGKKGSEKARKPIAEFCGVQSATVTRWLYSQKEMPVGTVLLKLTCYLDMIGYRIIELEKMPPSLRGFLELVAFGVITIDEGAQLLGYSSASTLYQILQGHYGAGEEKSAKMWSAWKERREVLDAKKQEALKKYKLPISLSGQSEKPKGLAIIGESEPSVRPSPGRAALRFMEGLLDLLDQSLAESLINDPTAGEIVLRLSARLSNMSSQLISMRQKNGGSS